MKWKEEAKLICEFKVECIQNLKPGVLEFFPLAILSRVQPLSVPTVYWLWARRPAKDHSQKIILCKRSFSRSWKRSFSRRPTSGKLWPQVEKWPKLWPLSSFSFLFSSSSSSANWCWHPELPRIEIQVSKSSFVHNNNKLQKAEAVAVEGFRFEANVKRRTIQFWRLAHTIVHLG